ncbi:HxlR family transcriptional regulator [Micromonospora globispora]|uniref:HxlR family transcriptional regulator n=1 Tax=Micromonospora globispora TaxID=1450148 RepID=A0A317KG42_9ACTN|nr:winged helix-turn-helix transcriptional regulator [Micromonospora globispora]PWU52532.1 HxlR family transcriptional regulator [Micromonospora globispora]PWU58380.1 HxlR family transcriptional regulator [Micromonospora globispora]RQW89756.1 HxlR family transcriptional regulator [Micromonospora globispora]
MRRADLGDADCGIAQALGVLGDWWTFLIVRDIAGGTTRFDALQRELGVSRRALTERLGALVEAGVLRREPYSQHPPRFDYLLTRKGEGLLPVLVALQDWGARHVMGQGDLTATADAQSAEARRVHHLVGRRVPEMTLARHDGGAESPVVAGRWTVLYLFPGAFAPGAQGLPPGWEEIPGAVGCTLESRTYADRHELFRAAGAEVRGVSTQRPDQLRAFAEHARLPYPLLSDQDGRLAAGLLLPTFRAGGVDRFKRLTLLVDPDAVVRDVQFPVTDPAGSVDEMLDLVRQRRAAPAH